MDDYPDANDGEGTGDVPTEGVDSLPATFTIESPHTDGVNGGHRYYAVRGDVASAFEARTGVGNPSPPWGDVRVSNQYCVGPGSQISPGGCVNDWCDLEKCYECDKYWCDECAKPDGGYYRIADDRPIAVIDAEDFVDTICADLPDDRLHDQQSSLATTAASGDTDTGADTDTEGYVPDPTATPASVIERNPWLGMYLSVGAEATEYTNSDGSGDRSDADYAACKDFVKAGVSKADAGTCLAASAHTKVNERGTAGRYWDRTWSRAVRAVAKEYEDIDAIRG